MDKTIANMIDHTLLKAEATKAQVIELCEEAKKYHFFSVCVNPTWIEEAKMQLQNSDVKVCTVIGFPLGATTTETKMFETKDAIQKGADEVDMVINIGKLKDKEYEAVQADIQAVVTAANGQALVKVIIETSLLTDEEKRKACELAVEAGADFVKTSTGFSTGGATVEDIRLMRNTVGPDIGVKASGGVRDQQTAKAVIDAGATRIGASSSIAIVKGQVGKEGY
ncbi:deoxyribose-phosphate aldolase [Alkalihalobacillus sp. LMS39]|uniref:deoxyribose-phosphate aldolase n=1 Tax=Alkalihalobacillus sp. LMS39 TaxID=2924032 RepID=UPI001FB1DCF3|nr:deoxyribose-phosphate aldolase [Alkalihalobacillus sp. LMS39]UOE95308.1 deoxyribose-phosphate aldolase [Alkalihalobacillus sp. LMS39]